MKLIISCVLLTLFIYRSSACVKPELRPIYHLAPPQGWMNDPNGFCFFQGEYHLFYQYNPYSSLEAGIANWGHAKSKDLFRWENLPIAMEPDESYDKNGVFSGSALIENRIMYLFYTGNLITGGTYDEGHEQRQALATSSDGVNFTKYEGNPVIVGADRQPNFRDPKVWKQGSKYYMVLGNSFENNTLGRVLLYESDDRINWSEVSILAESNGTLGYMWECPDFFELNGYFVLLFSPQGMEPQGDKYRNLYQTGYIVGKFDYDTNEFTQITEFVELDHGHDFYATQTIEDPKGRRLLVAWNDMWGQVYPEREDGWTGQMTLPRELYLTKDLKLKQRPVKEVRGVFGNDLYFGKGRRGTKVALTDNAGRIKVKANKWEDFELFIEGAGVNGSVKISYDALSGKVTLDRGGEDGVRRTDWTPRGRYLRWDIYIDHSSIELFCGDGEESFSSRFFPEGPVSVRLGDNSSAKDFTVTETLRTVALPEPCDDNLTTAPPS